MMADKNLNILIHLSRSGYIFDVSENFYKILGYNSSILNKDFSSILIQEDAKHLSKILKQKSEVVQHDLRLHGRKGLVTWFSFTIVRNKFGEFHLYGRDITSYKKMMHQLKYLGEEIPKAPDKVFFEHMAKTVSEIFDVDYVLINTPSLESKEKGHPLAYWTPEGIQELGEFDLSGTSCGVLVKKREFIHYPVKLQLEFPSNLHIVDINARSYVGIPALDEKKEILGWVSLLDSTRIDVTDDMLSLLRIFTHKLTVALYRMSNNVPTV